MKYKLLKDLPGVKAGITVKVESGFCKFPQSPESNGWVFSVDEMILHPDFFEPVEERWRPNMPIPGTNGDDIFWFNSAGDIQVFNGFFSEKTFEFGNNFRTKEQAEDAARRVKAALDKYHQEIGE